MRGGGLEALIFAPHVSTRVYLLIRHTHQSHDVFTCLVKAAEAALAAPSALSELTARRALHNLCVKYAYAQQSYINH